MSKLSGLITFEKEQRAYIFKACIKQKGRRKEQKGRRKEERSRKEEEMMCFGGVLLILVTFAIYSTTMGQLTPDFYRRSCPGAAAIIESALAKGLKTDNRVGASIVRMHFHDCFIQGCDASVLLDRTSSSESEKNAAPNKNSLRGFELVDSIKTRLEKSCPGIVSCADLLAMAAESAVSLAGGPSWTVPVGRRDSLSPATLDAVNGGLPSPFISTAKQLVSAFETVGLTANDLVSLSGAHTLGSTRCLFFTSRLYDFNGSGHADPAINKTFLPTLQRACPRGGDGNATVFLDADCGIECANVFDNHYFQNLVSGKGLLGSDHLLTDPKLRESVQQYSEDEAIFFENFKSSMRKMSLISPLTGEQGEVRKSCRAVNTAA